MSGRLTKTLLAGLGLLLAPAFAGTASAQDVNSGGLASFHNGAAAMADPVRRSYGFVGGNLARYGDAGLMPPRGHVGYGPGLVGGVVGGALGVAGAGVALGTGIVGGALGVGYSGATYDGAYGDAGSMGPTFPSTGGVGGFRGCRTAHRRLVDYDYGYVGYVAPQVCE